MLGTAVRVTKELAANRTLERLTAQDPERWSFVRDSLAAGMEAGGRGRDGCVHQVLTALAAALGGLTMGARVPIVGLLPHCQCKSAPSVGVDWMGGVSMTSPLRETVVEPSRELDDRIEAHRLVLCMRGHVGGPGQGA